MKIEIYEDQTGLMMFPEKRTDRNTTIVKFFDNKIDLCITKKGNEIEIICYLLIYRGSGRAIGCYIIGRDEYSKNLFSDFKKDADTSLQSIGFNWHTNNEENVMFNEIKKIDENNELYMNMKLIVLSHELGNKINFNGGSIDKIANLCDQLLKNIDNIRISISTVNSNIGNINIIRNKILNDQLNLTDQGKEVIERQRERVKKQKLDEKKKEEENRKKIEELQKQLKEEKNKKKKIEETIYESNTLDKQIEKGIKLIDDGLEIKRKLGYTNSHIDSDTRLINDIINNKVLAFPVNSYNEPFIDTDEKKQEARNGNTKIDEGTFLVKEAIITKRKTGYSDNQITNDTKIKNSCITIRQQIPINKYESEVEKQTDYTLLRILIIFGFAVAIGLISMYGSGILSSLSSPYLQDNKFDVTSTPTPTITASAQITIIGGTTSDTLNTKPTLTVPDIINKSKINNSNSLINSTSNTSNITKE